MKTKNFLVSGLMAGLIFCLHSCESNADNLETEPPAEVENPVINKAVFSGYVQKGPFINGSSVTISELNENLDQTGKTYFTAISDNMGSFEQKNIDLVSNFISLKADGYYFNEVSGKTSTGQITLYALVDIEDINSANVNVLTHLTRARIEYLVQQEALSFPQAKRQAQKEVLAIFGISTVESTSFESLDLTNNAYLLAISSILQGSLPTGDMAGLMADIITDIRTDGKLDNMALITKLVNNAEALSSSTVRNNLTAKYIELGMSTSIPDFESNVRSFIDSKTDPSAVITYPDNGEYGINFLSDAVTSVKQMDYYDLPNYSMKADVPLGKSLKIVINDQNRIGGSGSMWIMPLEPDVYLNGYQHTWLFSLRDQYNYTQEFSIIKSGQPNDLKIGFPGGKVYEEDRDYIIIEYYENGAKTPTKVKKLYVVDQ